MSLSPVHLYMLHSTKKYRVYQSLDEEPRIDSVSHGIVIVSGLQRGPAGTVI